MEITVDFEWDDEKNRQNIENHWGRLLTKEEENL